jgi:hypothetical protein
VSLHDAWTGLRHGGNLLSIEALDGLPTRSPAPAHLADALRAAIVSLPAQGPGGEALSTLLDLVLESLCGLTASWRKGANVGAADAERLLDGTAFKPRRVWEAPDGERLAVFTTPAQRIGVGVGRRPVAQVVEYLRRRSLPFGLLTNGREWRFVWADTDSLAWVEWDADRWLDADVLSAPLDVLRRVLSLPALARSGAAHAPLLLAIRETRRGQAKLSKELGERVRRSVEALLHARAPVVAPAWEHHAGTDVYVAACHLVMRLVVVLFAEARELLPIDNPVYHHAYGLRGLQDQLDRLTPERRRARHAAWPRLLALFRLLHAGSPHPALAVPAYGGDLFKIGDPSGDGVQRALTLLEAITDPPDDDAIHRILVLLTRTEIRVREGAVWRRVAAPVDFTELTSEYIGILYEGLLDYELRRADAEPIVFLALGDQPALPLDRLEGMDDKTLSALVEKAKVKKAAAEEAGDDAEEDDAPSDEAEEDDDAAGAPAVEAEAPAEQRPDDRRAAARARAVDWGRRAARVGKLVKKGKPTDPGYLRDLDAAANQLIADVKLPGELFLVRWGGTRKGAGTFYTRPQLTMPTVRRTLEPLLYTGEDAARTLRRPEELLALKVCDPAMGSGSFLVAALRTLTAALVESLHVHGRLSSENGGTTIRCDAFPEGDRRIPASSASGAMDERLDALARRAVVEHCLYGVDVDPLAVELGRVALWVETLDKRLPFTFLDHKLRCGNALIGTWLDRFRDYPLLAFDRESPDKKWKGVHHAADTWHDALKARRTVVIAEQAALLSSQARLFPGGTSDEELKTAVARVRRLYRELRAVPAGMPHERARIWRERIQTDPALTLVRTAFDTWCALWFWPLDRIADVPGPRDLHAPSEAAKGVAKAVRDRLRFFHWELEFPDVFTVEGAGFDAVVGNPPWETVTVQALEFFSNEDALYRGYDPARAETRRLELMAAESDVETRWLAENDRVRTMTNWVKNVGSTNKQSKRPFVRQGGGKLYTYRAFMEVAVSILHPRGRIGVIVPTILASEKGGDEIRRYLLQECSWEWMFDFTNQDELFPIHRSSRFSAVIAARGSVTVDVRCAAMVSDLERWSEARPSHMLVSRTLIETVSGTTYGLPLLPNPVALRVLTRLSLENGRFGGDGHGDFGIQFSREFNMKDDRSQFEHRSDLEHAGTYCASNGLLTKGEDIFLPLVEGRSIDQYQAFCARWESGKGRAARWGVLPPGATSETGAQYYVPRDTFMGSAKCFLGPKVAVMDVTGATNTRTVIASCLPAVPTGHSVNNAVVIAAADSVEAHLRLCASMNSFVFDYSVRSNLTGQHVSRYYLSQAPIPHDLLTVPGLDRGVLALNCTHPLFAGWWLNRSPTEQVRFALTPHERLRLRCMLDAIVATLYGLDRDDFAWILRDCDHPTARLAEKGFCRTLDPKGFWRVDKAQPPELRHTVLSLVAFDDLQRAIAAAGGRDAGIQAFCDQHAGDGWMLPEALCLADLGLTRSVDVGVYDDRARSPQPVAGAMGERFLDWQLAQTPEESWAECERHAKAILEGTAVPAPSPAVASTPAPAPAAARDLGPLFRTRR